MVDVQTERRLAAILIADVVGYSKLIQRDEEGTRSIFRRLEKNFFTPLVRANRGRIIKSMGDAFLMEFSSAVHAVKCAVELQNQINLHLADESSLDIRGLQFRIGVNIGDIIVEGDDIHGDGVNVAARLQTCAEPGGVCLSQIVHDQVRGKVDASFADGGEVELTNIDQPQKIYLWNPENLSNRTSGNNTAGHSEIAVISEAKKAAIAVLPFDNMSGDQEQEYFSDGISEDIITELSRFRELHVKARNSSFAYKGQRISIQEMGQKLDVSYVVEGSVRKAGNRVRVTVQMVDVENGLHVWAERFDRNLEDIFAVQDEITKSIVSVLPNRLRDALSEQVQRKSTADFSAYEYFLHGRWLFINTAGTDPKAVEFLSKAIEIDPKYAQSHAVLANLYAYNRFSLGVWYEEPEAKARPYIDDAIKYGKNDPTVHTLVGEAYYWLGEHDKAKFNIETAMKLNPHDVQTMTVYGAVLNGLGESREGLSWMDKALEMDPHVPEFSWESKAECLFMLREYEECLKILLSWQDPPPHSYAQMAACYVHLGQMEMAHLAAEKFRTVCAEDENFPRYAANHASICKRDEDKENWLSGYRMAGLLD
jgi:adenylate cyclase